MPRGLNGLIGATREHVPQCGMGTRWRAGRSVVLAAVLAACSGHVEDNLGSNAHPDCRTDSDCRASGGGAICDHGTCRIADAGPAGHDGGTSEDSGSFAKPPPTQGFFVPIANPPPTSEADLGDALLALVATARANGWDAERALRERLRTIEHDIRRREAGDPT